MRRVLYVLLAVAVGLCATTAQADKPSKAKGLPRVKQELQRKYPRHEWR